jgi:gluconokinase
MTTAPSSPPEPPLVLSLDIGTSSIRASVWDSRGQPVPGLAEKATYPLSVTDDGGVEANIADIVASAAAAIDALLAAAGPLAGQIAGVGMCSLASSLLGVDAQGQPTTPVYTWADTRPAVQVATIRRTWDVAALHERTGCVAHTSYLPARFLWLQETQPAAFRMTRWWLSIGEYLALQFLGVHPCSLSVASWTGLLNRHTLQWDAATLDKLPVGAEQLSPLTDVAEPMQGLTPAYADRWPALRAIPWFPAVGDGVTANLGSGCDAPDEVALTVGTSGAMRVVVPGGVERLPPGLWVYRVDRRRALFGGALSNGGNLFDWMRHTLHLGDPAAVDAALRALPPDGHGLTVLPFLAGERSPGWNPNARAAIIGLSLATSPLEILQAGLEAVAYRFALIYRDLVAQVPAAQHFTASGGGLLHSPAWMQIMADVLGHPVAASTVDEASSRGNALLALEGLGVIPRAGALPVAPGSIYEPHPAHQAIYAAALARHEELYAGLLGEQRTHEPPLGYDHQGHPTP